MAFDQPTAAAGFHARSSGSISFNFCRVCRNLVSWQGLTSLENGKIRIAVNPRLAGPEEVAHIPLQRFDGLQSFEDMPATGVALPMFVSEAQLRFVSTTWVAFCDGTCSATS
jgi:hypothetical protein